jgi:hypothetical protein
MSEKPGELEVEFEPETELEPEPEAELEPEAEPEPEVTEPESEPELHAEPEQPSRRDRRIETLTTSLAEERRLREETNRRLDALLAGQQNRPPAGETPEARAQRLALLTPEERITAELHEARRDFSQQMQVVQFQSQDNSDRAAYEAKATVDPLYAKWRPKVETELAELRRQNMNVSRERLMYYLIGKNAVEGRQAVKGQQRAEGRRRVEQQRTRPANSGSDVAGSRRDRNASLERRLENQSL